MQPTLEVLLAGGDEWRGHVGVREALGGAWEAFAEIHYEWVGGWSFA